MRDFPENKSPMLICEGACEKSMVRHIYSGYKEISRTIKMADWTREWSEPTSEITIRQSGYVFRCFGCGFERIFGRDDDREKQ